MSKQDTFRRFRPLCFSLLACSGALAQTPQTPQVTQSFRDCVASGGTGGTCWLDQGTWYVASTINVTRSNIVIKGNWAGGSSPYPTLKRDRYNGNGPAAIVSVAASYVTFENIGIDGAYGAGVSVSPPTGCYYLDGFGNRAPNSVLDFCYTFSDLDVQWPSSHVTVLASTFVNGAERSIRLQGNDHLVDWSNVGFARGCGIHIGRSERTAVYHSEIWSNFGAGVCISGGTISDITIGNLDSQRNHFYRNHWGLADGSNGGQIYVGGGTNNHVVGNYVEGAWNSSEPGQNVGIEVDPGNVNALVHGNAVFGHGEQGINIKWNNTNVVVEYGTVWANNLANVAPNEEGIQILGSKDRATSEDPNPFDPTVTIRDVAGAGTNSPYDLRPYGFTAANKVCVSGVSTSMTRPSTSQQQSENNGYLPIYNNTTCP
jgi:hypothetical protein